MRDVVVSELSKFSNVPPETPEKGVNNQLFLPLMNSYAIHDHSAGTLPQFDRHASKNTAVHPEGELALGVLKQAVSDLRRFKSAHDKVGRELYLDAYSWIISPDTSWPYSFLNVCEVIGAKPELLRLHILGNVGWLRRSARFGQRLMRSVAAPFQGSNKKTAVNPFIPIYARID